MILVSLVILLLFWTHQLSSITIMSLSVGVYFIIISMSSPIYILSILGILYSSSYIIFTAYIFCLRGLSLGISGKYHNFRLIRYCTYWSTIVLVFCYYNMYISPEQIDGNIVVNNLVEMSSYPSIIIIVGLMCLSLWSLIYLLLPYMD